MQFRSAENGSVPMQIWLGKQYLEQKEKQEVEKSTDHNIIINVSEATEHDI